MLRASTTCHRHPAVNTTTTPPPPSSSSRHHHPHHTIIVTINLSDQSPPPPSHHRHLHSTTRVGCVWVAATTLRVLLGCCQDLGGGWVSQPQGALVYGFHSQGAVGGNTHR
ncbi:hypothetical protein Tco_1437764, partial [Tanacetum coccineum]